MWRADQAQAIVRGARRVAFVGAAKNCGKTTTMNAFLAEAASLGGPVGLVSIGIDGESQDLLIGTAKPTIPAPAGALIVSAQGAFAQSSVRVESLASLGGMTPMGELVLARVVEPGAVMLAGIRHRKELLSALELLSRFGAAHIFIDGAYGRTMAAHAQVSDAVVLCTGAILDRRVDEIVAQTQALLERLSLPAPTSPVELALLARAREQQRALLWDEDAGEALALPNASALLGLAQGRALWTPSVTAVAIPGLVSDKVIEELLAVPSLPDGRQRALLLQDATALQAASRLVDRLKSSFEVRAMGSVPIAAISYNPTSIAGYSVEAQALQRGLEALDTQRWVFDPRA